MTRHLYMFNQLIKEITIKFKPILLYKIVEIHNIN